MQEEARRLQEGPALLPEGHHTEVDSSLTDTRHQTVTSAGVAGTQLGRVWGTLQCWAPESSSGRPRTALGRCLELGRPVLHCRGGLPFKGATLKPKEQVLRARYILSHISTEV